MTHSIDKFLDIREDVCPITFVKARLLVETMSSGEQAEILLRGTEPIENVPGSIKELGHGILDIRKIDDMDGPKPPSYEADDVRMVIRKT